MKKAFSAVAVSFITLGSFAQDINLYPDSLHFPFIYGVTSGDPTDSSVIIWTAIADDSANTPQLITWQLAADSTFSSILKSDSLITNRSRAYTVKVDITGLLPFTKYCYRFSLNAQYSVTGFTETAPDQPEDSLKFALVSCSSLFSGYFNAYRQIANNHTIDAVIHVGDFIYDAIDPQELVRIPQPQPSNPVSLEDWRNRYRLYLLDPDLREARRMHPWIQIWDNHDLKNHSFGICSKAFFDFTPVRQPPQDSTRIWRKLSYGPLADIVMLDDWQYSGDDTFTDGREKMLSDEQFHWLLNELDTSHAIWKILAVSKLLSPWNLGTFTSMLPGGGLNDSWEGYPESRDSLLGHLAQSHIQNSVVLSGDLHMNIVSDLALNPFDSVSFNGSTGAGGLGIEINGASVSRGNLDESGIAVSSGSLIYQLSFNSNPQQRYLNLFDHGYALLTFNSDNLTARMMLCPILELSNAQVTDTVLVCRVNENHWLRAPTATGIDEAIEKPLFSVFPNPANDELNMSRFTENSFEVEFFDALGQRLIKVQDGYKIDVSALHRGIYIVRVKAGGNYYSAKFFKE